MNKTIHVAFSRFGAGNAPMSYGIAHGVFQQRDLNVVMDIPMARGEEVMKSLESREADVATGSGLPILRIAARGARPRIVMSIENENVFAVIGAPGIDRPENLRGKTVGICGDEDQDGVIMRRFMAESRLRPGVDVEFRTFVGGRGAIWDSLLTGEVSAMASTIPEPINARALGLPILHDFAARHEPYQSGSMVVRQDLIDRDPELLVELISAQVQGIQMFRSDPEGALSHIRRCTRIINENVLLETHRLFGEAMLDFVPSTEPLAALIRDVRAFSMIPVDDEADHLLDSRFAAAVAQRGGAPVEDGAGR